MAGESQLPPSQGPDPSDLTQAAIDRATRNIHALREAQFERIDTRLNAMDEAAKVLHETVTRTPTDIEQAVGHLKELMGVELGAVALQFSERDTRAERESRDNKLSVDAAFAAQEKLGVAQNKSNAEAIAKSEEATKETIDKLEKLFNTSNSALAERIEAANRTAADKNDDLKDRLNGIERMVNGRLSLIESAINGAEKTRQGGKEQRSDVYALGGFILVVITIIATLAASGVFSGNGGP